MLSKIVKLRDKAVEKFDEIQEKARAHWISLNEREKRILTILAAVVSVLVIAVAVKETSFIFTHVASQSESNIKNLERIQSYVQELQSQRPELMKYERLHMKRGDDFAFNTFIDTETKKFGLNLAKTNPTRVIGDAEAEKTEEWLEIQIKDATLDSVVKFLASIEETLGLKLIDLSMKVQFQDQTKLDATIVISNKKNV